MLGLGDVEVLKFFICLIQREVILVKFVNERFWTAVSLVQWADLGFLDVFSSSDASGCHLS